MADVSTGSVHSSSSARVPLSDVIDMRLAIHSIVWGNEVDLEELLCDVKQAGYSGLELFQPYETLGTVQEIHDAVRRHGLHLVGSNSGSFDDRVEFVREYARAMGKRVSDPEVPYVYLDERIDQPVKDALDEGFRIALHPHMYKPVQTLNEAARVLELYPDLRFLPDTAHLKIAGDKPEQAIHRFASRIDAIHIKDWQENVGRSYHFYARGFCRLGSGDIDLMPVLNAVDRRVFRAWLVVEQDWSTQPGKDARESYRWLHERLPRRRLDGA